MIIGKVLGNVWATKKDEQLEGCKLLVIKTGWADGTHEMIVAVDTIGAGVDDDVLVTKGSVAGKALCGFTGPVDAVVIGIIDSVEVDEVFLKQGRAK